MTNIEKVNKALVNANEDKIKEVLDFLGYKEDSKFIPKNGELYYFITPFDDIDFAYRADDKYDNHFLLMNNVYQNKEEAEQALDLKIRKAKLIKEIEDSSEPMDFSDTNQYKHHIGLDGRYNALRVGANIHVQIQGATYTTNKQFLRELIKERYDEVKELLFGIKL